MTEPALVRPAAHADLGATARLAGKLVRMHHAFDAQRFMLLENVEAGYERFFASQLASPDAVILVADRAGTIVGYAYGALEGRNWNNLLEACGAIHDVFVDAEARRHGVAGALVTEMLRRLEALGAPRVVLHTAWANESAQGLFAALGFRRTMLEMTRERGA